MCETGAIVFFPEKIKNSGMIRNITVTIVGLLRQIEAMLERLTDEEFAQAIPILSGATIGQHTRHILEFYLELACGYDHGEVNYDARKRDCRIESDRYFAIREVENIVRHLGKADKQLRITAEYGAGQEQVMSIGTNYCRELVYNLEHTVHHMAMLRIGVSAISPVTLPDDFGVAISTLKYRNTCAQ